jgi:hypothetical protein
MSRDELVTGWCEWSIGDTFGSWTKKLRLELDKFGLGYI